ncbi:hypothetical protein C3Z09_12590 [Lelliottia aquatilis]|uniref:YcgJ family protein n=1 Tax=Lelliottia aquatilis TaxID=2080838 RepID=UPI000CDF0BE7|nr:YcgJ family protein [Lelliottia aquatilis]POZ16187.1 hypothetical protein C3Z09_12590 [Lelliottia aquatilis]
MPIITILRLVFLILSATVVSTGASTLHRLASPAQGVVCDVFFCADAKGVSDALTTQFLGQVRGEQLSVMGDFYHSAFTFANRIFCDTKAKVCRKDRFFDADGKRSGSIEDNTTRLLFEP